MVARLERIVHHAAHDLVNVGRMWVTRAIVHGCLIRELVCGVTRLEEAIRERVYQLCTRLLDIEGAERAYLQDVERASHVAARELEQRLSSILCQADPVVAAEVPRSARPHSTARTARATYFSASTT